ncbi:hypothetical protein THAOC_29884, partial [Thalassiosira oceanica]
TQAVSFGWVFIFTKIRPAVAAILLPAVALGPLLPGALWRGDRGRLEAVAGAVPPPVRQFCVVLKADGSFGPCRDTDGRGRRSWVRLGRRPPRRPLGLRRRLNRGDPRLRPPGRREESSRLGALRGGGPGTRDSGRERGCEEVLLPPPRSHPSFFDGPGPVVRATNVGTFSMAQVLGSLSTGLPSDGDGDEGKATNSVQSSDLGRTNERRRSRAPILLESSTWPRDAVPDRAGAGGGGGVRRRLGLIGLDNPRTARAFPSRPPRSCLVLSPRLSIGRTRKVDADGRGRLATHLAARQTPARGSNVTAAPA